MFPSTLNTRHTFCKLALVTNGLNTHKNEKVQRLLFGVFKVKSGSGNTFWPELKVFDAFNLNFSGHMSCFFCTSVEVTAPPTGPAELLQRSGRFLRFCVDENFSRNLHEEKESSWNGGVPVWRRCNNFANVLRTRLDFF